jgi:RecA/RadA recombinase
MRTLSVSNIYAMVHELFAFDGEWREVLGAPQTNGIWVIYGREKNGKTTFSLQLAHYLSAHKRTLYVSAEEGISTNFVETCRRAGIDATCRELQFLPYTDLNELKQIILKRRAPQIIFLDNATVYEEEFKNGGFRNFLKRHKDVLVVLIAHEERAEPYTAAAKLAKKLAQVIIRVEGLNAHVSGRVPGGKLTINPFNAEIYEGNY